jgi:alpha-mannosidase
MDRYHVAAADQIPALGYKTWTIAFEGSASFQLANKKDGQAGSSPYLHCARHSLENEFVRLLVRKDGRIDLYDKPTRTWYRGLHFFEDCGDAGEGWNHIYPTRDTVVLSTDANSRGKARVALGHQSPLTASIKVSLSMRVPSDLVVETSDKPQRKATTSRSRKFVTLPIETTFTLDAGSRRVDCRTTISNTARCHRVRAIFPTNRKTNVWFGDNAFDTVRRNIKLRDTTGWNEREREECPIKDFVAACDSRAGLAVLTKGLYEAAVQDNRSRSIALTLFRGFVERLFFENTQDSLLLGELAMEYALLPFTPERGAPPATIYGEIDRYKLALPTYTRPSSGEPVDIVTLPPYSETNPPQPAPSVGTEVITPSPELAAILKARPKLACDLPPTGSLLELGAPLALSTIKTSEDGTAIIVRVWNPDTRPAKSFLRPAFAFSRVSKTDLLEKPVAKLAAHGQTIPLTLRAKEVVTIRLEK